MIEILKFFEDRPGGYEVENGRVRFTTTVDAEWYANVIPSVGGWGVVDRQFAAQLEIDLDAVLRGFK